jgi:hypothetical protein
LIAPQVYGAEYIQELLQRMPVLSEREGRKLLSYGAATYWLLQMDDAE